MSDQPTRSRRSIIRRARKPVVGTKRPKRIVRRASHEETGSGRRFGLRKPGRVLVLSVSAVAFISLVAGAAWLWQSPLLRVQQVQVSGHSAVSEETVLGRLDVLNQSMFTVDLGAAERRVTELAWVASARVEQQWPDTIVVIVEERTPWGTWEQAGGEYTVDRDGVVLSRRPASPDLPVIRSFQPFGLQPGDRVDYQAIEAATEIYESLPGVLGTEVSEVAYVAGKGVQVTTTSGETALLGDSSAVAYKLAVWASVAAEAASQGLGYSTIDLRYGNRPVLQ